MSLLFQSPVAHVRRVVRTLTGSSSSPLAGRVVMITGASSGIGEATAREVARVGGIVLLVARRVEALQLLRSEIEAAGGTAYVHPCDLTDGDAVDALVEDVTLEHGAVDYLVNNAGRSIRRSLALSHDRFHDFERTMAVNYFGPVRLTMGLLPAMRAQRFGHVVNIVTWGIQVKAPKFAAYIASKTALDTFSRIAGREAFFDNVTFTNMRLSLVHTPMTAPTEVYADRRGLTPEQAARKVVRALEDRPITMNVAVGTASELINLVAPRLSDFTMATLDRLLPDSAAAKGAQATEPETMTSVTDNS
jgi:NAD(P)-dependent dehydrogenase (short-subunit alcohol dehydrogenase family)